MNSSKHDKASILVQSIDSLLSGESSIELTQTSRGTNWKVKIYHPDPLKALELANQIYDKCKEKYGDNGDKGD